MTRREPNPPADRGTAPRRDYAPLSTLHPLLQRGLDVLQAPEPTQKVQAAHDAFCALRRAQSNSRAAWPAKTYPGPVEAPMRPARPTRPALRPPSGVPRRRLSSPQGRIALLHAVAHIEFNAIDLAFDMAVRFAPAVDGAGLDGEAFIADWFQVGDDEARHFTMINARLAALGAHYGDLPAHDGLWEAAIATADSVLARLAIAPMVLEARGLDVTPQMATKLAKAGDGESAAILETICREEVAHVAAGRRWFEALCRVGNLDPRVAFRDFLANRFTGSLKPPFNVEARDRAGLARDYYLDVNTI